MFLLEDLTVTLGPLVFVLNVREHESYACLVTQRPGVQTRADSRRDRTEKGLELRASGTQTNADSVAKIQLESTG